MYLGYARCTHVYVISLYVLRGMLGVLRAKGMLCVLMGMVGKFR